MSRSEQPPLRVAIAGLGTVGAATLQALQEREPASDSGRPVTVVAVCARDRHKPRPVSIVQYQWFDCPLKMVQQVDADVYVELIGSCSEPVIASHQTAMRRGMHVVTANKALLASHGDALVRLAEQNKVGLKFEAAVAGGIPVVHTLRDAFRSNRIHRIMGILNGTCNYILTRLLTLNQSVLPRIVSGSVPEVSFAQMLADAQSRGYAEADPSADIDGLDSGHKLALLSSLAFGIKIDLSAVRIEGIRQLTAIDLLLAQQLGYRVKLLGLAEYAGQDIIQRVQPVLVRQDTSLARVDGVDNAVLIQGEPVGMLMLQGPGAGAAPTTSAVISDLLDIALNHIGLPMGRSYQSFTPVSASDKGGRHRRYFLAVDVIDKPGVLAGVAQVLHQHEISVESTIQPRADGTVATLIVVTHDCSESVIQAATEHLASLDFIRSAIRVMPIFELAQESLPPDDSIAKGSIGEQ